MPENQKSDQPPNFTTLQYYKYHNKVEDTYGATFALCQPCADLEYKERQTAIVILVKIDAPCFAQYCQGKEHKRLKTAANVSVNSSLR